MLLSWSSSVLLLSGDWIGNKIIRYAHGGQILRADLKGLRDMMLVVHVVFLESDADRSHHQARKEVFDLSK